MTGGTAQLLLASIVTVGACVQWLTGMGFALVAVPALVLLLGPLQGVALANCAAGAISAAGLVGGWRRVRLTAMVPLVVASACTVPAGRWVAAQLPQAVLLVGMGLLVTLAVLLVMCGLRVSALAGSKGAVAAGAATGTGRPPGAGQDVRVLSAAGATVLPGLIDAHVHLLVTSLDMTAVAAWTPGYLTVRALAEAERMLRRGFTTVRDVGGADHGMAQALAEGLALGPRLVHGGKALSQTGGHGDLRPLGDDSVPCCESRPHFARIADGVDAVRAAARDEFRKGAAHLKVLLSGGVASPHDEIAAVQYSEEEIRAAVQEAENHNRYVTAHAYHPRAIDRALRAGVRCIEHGNLIDETTIQLLLERDAFLVPTLVAYEQTAKLSRQSGLPESSYRKLTEVRDHGLAALEKAHRAGVNLVYGSDLLGPLHSAQLEEFTLRAEVQPAADVIRSATSTAARLLRMEGEIGTLAPGAHADLLVVDGDPLADLTVITRPERHLRHVIKAGSVL